MLIDCAVCGSERVIIGKEAKYAPDYLDFLCSAECVKKKIESFPLVGLKDVKKWLLDYRIIRQKEPRGGEAYSLRLDMWFASQPEADVAEVLLDWGEVAYYEPLVLKLNRGYLIPDFVLPFRRLFIEVKGIWGMSQSSKVEGFLEDYPDTNYIMISKLIYRDFMKLRRDIGQRGRKTA